MPDFSALINVSSTGMMSAAKLRAVVSALTGIAWEGKRTIVEIGVYLGNTTVFMATVMREINEIVQFYCIDPFELAREEPMNSIGNRSACETKLRKNGIAATIIAESSESAADKVPSMIGFLSIDGSHLRENVSRDLELYAPKVAPGGMMYVDDYGYPNLPGIAQAVDEWIPDHPEFKLVRQGHFALFRRMESA